MTEVFVSLRSPYARLAVALAGGAVRWIPWWSPEGDLLRRSVELAGGSPGFEPMTLGKVLYSLADARRMHERAGLPFRRPAESPTGWDLPHLCVAVAREDGRGDEALRALMAARWEEGKDICRPEVVDAIARSVGLEGTWIERTTCPGILEEVARDFAAARRHGVFGVPFGVRAGRKAWGTERTLAMIEEEGEQQMEWNQVPELEPDLDWEAAYLAELEDVPGEILATPGCLDLDHAGGCG